MPIALDSRRRGCGDASFGRRGQSHARAAAGPYGGSSSSERTSDSRAAVLHWGEGDDDDGEVQSSYRGPFDTMDALQDALPSNRRGVSKFYNGKSSSVPDVADMVSSPQPAKGPANPGNPSPKKRKGFRPFSFSWNKSRGKESNSRGGVTKSPKSCRKTLSPAATSCAPRSSMSNNEHERCQDPPHHCLQRGYSTTSASASPPTAALRSQLISVQMKSVSVAGVQDVAESTASVSPREKRRKSLQY